MEKLVKLYPEVGDSIETILYCYQYEGVLNFAKLFEDKVIEVKKDGQGEIVPLYYNKAEDETCFITVFG
jgi:hypothetical protein